MLTVTVNPSVRLYPMVGLEANCAIFGAGNDWFETAKAEVISRVAPMLSQVRFEATARDIDDGVDLDFSAFDERVDRALKPLMIAREAATGFPLQVNICYVGFGAGNPNKWPNPPHGPSGAQLERYAAFALACVDRMATVHGVRPVYWEVCLEPDNAGNTPFNAKEKLAEAIKAARGALDGGGYEDVGIIAPSCVSAIRARDWATWFKASDPTAWSAIDIVSYHGYTSSTASVAADIAAVADGKKTAMNEWNSAPTNRPGVDLLNGRVSLWQRYGIANNLALADPNGLGGICRIDPVTGAVSWNRRTPEMHSYFAGVRPGAWRIGCSLSGSEAFAYERPDGTVAVTARVGAGNAVQVVGVPDGDYRVTKSGDCDIIDCGTVTASGGSLQFAATTAALYLVEGIR